MEDGNKKKDNNEYNKQSYQNSSNQLTNKQKITTSLLSGAIAGALAKTTIAPLDRTKIYFQTTPSSVFTTRSVLRYLQNTYKTHGFRYLFRGNSATMWRVVPYCAIQFTAHEQYKLLLTPYASRNPHSARFLAGTFAGVTAQMLTYPLDLTRARMAVSKEHEYRNLSEVFLKVRRTEGLLGLYRGWFPTMLGVIPYAGFSFYSYETCKKMWKDRTGVEPSAMQRLLFGAMSGVLGQTASYPLDIVRRRMQVNGSYKKGVRVFRILTDIWRTEGLISGLYKGLSMNWIKGPVAAGISFSVFDWTNNFLRKIIREG